MSWLARLSTNVREIRVYYNPAKASSHGTREFISTSYNQIKRLNPNLPFLVRPGGQIEEAKIIARYDYGGEAERVVNDLSVAEIKEKLKELVQLGEAAPKADHYPWQEGYKLDKDVVDFEPYPTNPFPFKF
eukprot:TRINITY_DN13246_c0_g1_i1.p1 TRINITY_DN13246_c0_g1~~TRINITY_DN13246_c0_g1_i1.p1  ORF type:complete len:138 (+),score=26.31 TRINITY_DN13246_c0_g1_i1:23-415(+)